MWTAEVEEAAASLGASRWQIFSRVIFPLVRPALLTGFAMAFARALGEYGSVVFISGNMPMRTEITPLLIITRLEQYDYAGATAIAAGDAGGLVRAAAGHQPAAVAQPQVRGGQMRTAQRTRLVRWTLIALALLFLALFVALPLGDGVRAGAGEGLGGLLGGHPRAGRACRDPPDPAGRRHRRSVEPGLRRGGGLGHRQVPVHGQELPGDSDRSAVCGLAGHLRPDLRAAVRRAGLAGPVAGPITTSRSSSPCRASCWPRSS